MYKTFSAHKCFHIYRYICSLNKFIVFELGRAEGTISIALLKKSTIAGQITQFIKYSTPTLALLFLPIAIITMAITLCNNISIREKERARSIFLSFLF